MAASSDDEPDRGKPIIKTIPGDPKLVEYLNTIEW